MINNKLSEWEPNIWPPFTQIINSTPPSLVTRANGALLFPDQSPPLIDAISSWWVTLHGHANQQIADAISKQAKELEQVIFADFIHPQAEKLARRLSVKTGLERLFFSDNGSTAVEVAIKIACQYWQNINEKRLQIIAFEGAYHGDTFGAMAIGERNLFNAPFESMLFPVSRVPWPATWWGDQEVEEREAKVLSELTKLLETPTAAVILEPLVQGAGGMSMVRPEFLRKANVLINEAGALLIADEVLTGFGRCGTLFGYEQASLQPDLIALSKGLTGGFLPMGVTMASQKIFEAFIDQDPQKTFWHGHSFTGNPLGCAAANASLDLLENNTSKYTEFEFRHLEHLQNIAKHPKVTKVRAKGTIAAFTIKVEGEKGYLNIAGKKVKKKAMEQGVFIRPLGDVVYLMPPLCITNSELEQCYHAIKYGLDSL